MARVIIDGFKTVEDAELFAKNIEGWFFEETTHIFIDSVHVPENYVMMDVKYFENQN